MHCTLFLIFFFLTLLQSNSNNNRGVLAQIDDSFVHVNNKQKISSTTESSLIAGKKEGFMTTTTSTTTKPKTMWPELVGVDGEEAKVILEEMEPDKKIILVPEGRMVTMDYRTDRIRIFLDGEGKVSRAPTIG